MGAPSLQNLVDVCGWHKDAPQPANNKSFRVPRAGEHGIRSGEIPMGDFLEQGTSSHLGEELGSRQNLPSLHSALCAMQSTGTLVEKEA